VKKFSSRGKLGGKGEKFALASGEEAIIGRKLARSTVRRTTGNKLINWSEMDWGH